MTTAASTIRRLAAADAAAYRELRLEALRTHPESFGASWEDESSRPVTWFVERLQGNVVFGGTLDGVTLMGDRGPDDPRCHQAAA